MRALALIAAIGSLAPFAPAADKLSLEDRVELTRGLSFEYANAVVLIPRSKKALEFDASKGGYDKPAWSAVAKESGPAARKGDTVQVTKIELQDDRIVFIINNGFGGGRHWYQNAQVSANGNAPVPIANNDTNAPGGTSIVVLFHKSLEGLKASEVKKMLAPILDFDRHSVTEIYSETLPPETQKAIKEKRALVGMDKDQVHMALGQRTRAERNTSPDGDEIEDWIYGTAPGKITFVTFTNGKVSKVKEAYAGLGTDVGAGRQ